MDYRIATASYTNNNANIVPKMQNNTFSNDARQYGIMNDDMLIDKFSETDLGYDEDEIYDSFARNTLCDRTPDKNKFEYEEPRDNSVQSKSFLNLRHTGARGEGTPYMPEIFTGFIGETDREVRGINTDPDFKQLKKQQEARMKFIRFSKDDSNFVVDGVRAERREIADKQAVYKIMRDRTRVFSRQLDGRTVGKHSPVYENKSNICKQVLIQSYGDDIKDKALTPQRKANIICDGVIRDSREYRDYATDQDMDYARYTMRCKSARQRQENKVAGAEDRASCAFGKGSSTKAFKSTCILMKNACDARANLVADNDTDMAITRDTLSRKTAPISRDITAITSAIKQDAKFKKTRDSQAYKSATPQERAHMMTVTDNDRYLADMHYNNALAINKATKHGDIRKATTNIVADNKVKLPSDRINAVKSAKHSLRTGMNYNTDYDADAGTSIATHQYKASAKLVNDSKLYTADWEEFEGQSDETMMYKTGNQARDSAGNVIDHDSVFSNNLGMERHGAPVGSKYMMRGHTDRDARDEGEFR
jgi:hypothetical protein